MEEDTGNPSGTDHELELSVAHDGAEDLQLGSVNSNSTLEIVVDGSELLNEELGSEGLQLSITFEKTEGAQGHQNDLADRLDGVELRVSLAGTQAVGVEVVSSRDGNEEILQPGDLQISLDDSDRNSRGLTTETHTDTLASPSCGNMEEVHVKGNHPPTVLAFTTGDEGVESDKAMENCEAGDANLLSEKKRSREEEGEEGRCLKLKTMEVKDEELEDCLRTGLEHVVDHVKPESDNALGSGLQDMESFKPKAELETSESNGEFLSNNIVTIIEGKNGVANGTCNETQEACGGEGLNIDKCNNGSTESVSLRSKGETKEIAFDRGGRTRHGKRRKIAMLLAYCGAGYQGMQKNPGAVTIEGLLEDALLKAGAMPDNYDGNPRKVDWMRAARTDKGVSAVGQVVSGLFYIDPPGFIERVNAHLPKQIHLLGYKRVTPTFSAKKFCDRRRYEYVIPVFALDPSTHKDREAVLASEGKEDAFIKCLECSERGRKIPAGKVFRRPSSDKVERDIDDGQIAVPESPSTTSDSGSPVTPCAADQSHQDAIPVDVEQMAVLKEASLVPPEEDRVNPGPFAAVPEPKREPFHFGDAERARLNRILSHYVGTHNFHNFTSRVKAEDPSAKRYMVSFEAGDVFTVGNTEFVRCTVVGQSFMLHQIRKMIGLAIAVFRGFAPESILETALRRDTNITIPTAPELGLFLDECMYPAYNQKWYNTHEEVSQKGHEEDISRFKHEVIYEHIAVTEHKEGQMALFLHSLNDRNYADLASAREVAAAKLVLS